MPSIKRDNNTIIIELSDDEALTMDWVDSLSSIMFSNYIDAFLKQRKAQHESELRDIIVKDLTREELIAEVAKVQGRVSLVADVEIVKHG
jgi:predicted ArsR family transcriptional regulator